MKKSNFCDLDFMMPNEINKEVKFNQNIKKIDGFLVLSAEDFVKEVPQGLNIGSSNKYIIDNKQLNYHNHIAYKIYGTGSWEYLRIPEGFTLYVIKQGSFYIFKNSKWSKCYDSDSSVPREKEESQQMVQLNKSEVPKNFTGIEKSYKVINQYSYLYLNGNTSIDLSEAPFPELTIIIKQNFEQTKCYKIEWVAKGGAIVWMNKSPHQITLKANVIEIVKFYRLPETIRFLGQIVGQKYEY